MQRVERDERWHVGFGLRCLIESQPSRELLDELLARAEAAAAAWGDAVPPTCASAPCACARRLTVASHEEIRAVA